ncbi:hypothetical protein [Sphingomonas sp. NPDC079357]
MRSLIHGRDQLKFPGAALYLPNSERDRDTAYEKKERREQAALPSRG